MNLNALPAPKLAPLPSNKPTSTSVQGAVVGVDELGVVLLSKHLPLPGAALELAGELARAISGKDSPIPVRVLSAGFEEPASAYRVYLEFNAEDTALRASVRRWIESR